MNTTLIATDMDNQVTLLEKAILDLGQMVEAAIARSIVSLTRRDELLARAVIEEDKRIDRAEVEVQEMCLDILEKIQPTGIDLRFVVAVLKINDSLERIGDLAENVAKVVVDVGNWERFLQVGGLTDLAEKAQRMVKDSLIALINRDATGARKVILFDDNVDAAQDRIKEQIGIELDRIPENANPLLRLEHVSRQFERIGDVACNIAEEVIYLVEGQIIRHQFVD